MKENLGDRIARRFYPFCAGVMAIGAIFRVVNNDAFWAAIWTLCSFAFLAISWFGLREREVIET